MEAAKAGKFLPAGGLVEKGRWAFCAPILPCAALIRVNHVLCIFLAAGRPCPAPIG